MKKNLITLLLIVLSLFLLTACENSGNDIQGSSVPESNSFPDSEGDINRQTSNSMQLIIGTFLLEDTQDAISSEQAAELLPLWKAVRSLSSSDTAAAEEINALYDQINEKMTEQQMTVINNINPQEEMGAVMEKHDISFGPRAQGSANSRDGSTDSNPALMGPPGGVPGAGQGGGVPGSGPGAGAAAGGQVNHEQLATMQAERQASGARTNQFASQFYDALMSLLEERAQGS